MEHSGKEQLEIINRQIRELVGIYRGAIGRAGISENEFWIWYALIVMEGEYSQQDICGLWSLSKQTVNTIVVHMAQRGLVSLEVVPGTRNRKAIRLTKAGRRYGESVVLPIFEAERRTLDRLPAEDRAVCTAMLGRYVGILKEEVYGTKTE